MAAPPPELGLLSVSTCPGIVLIWLAVIGPVLRSRSDGTTIPRSARCLLYGFDPAGMFLLFFVQEPNFRPLDANQGGARDLAGSSLATGRVWGATRVRRQSVFSS